ncbi:MAG: hypothetical protein AB1523_11720, partial [Bacillota bacterium]
DSVVVGFNGDVKGQVIYNYKKTWYGKTCHWVELCRIILLSSFRRENKSGYRILFLGILSADMDLVPMVMNFVYLENW